MYYECKNELKHHGIKGQKWGVRRFQNEDGSLTASGKKRYGDSDRIKTAEEEYKGDKLKKSSDDYRSKMILKYAGRDPTKAAFYTNASDELIQEEFIRRENVKKAIIAGAVVVGVVSACAIAYKMSCKKQLNYKIASDTGDISNDVIGNIMKKAKDDVDYCLPTGHEFHRMVGFKNFDLKRTSGKVTYVTATDADRASYGLFLKDWSGTGKRWDVTLKAKTDIKIPSDSKAREIFKQVYDSDPNYEKELRKTLETAYSSVSGMPARSAAVQAAVNDKLKDPFAAGMYGFVKQGKDSKKLIAAYKEHGYSAIVDYFDKGSMGELPMILFDAESTVTKVGEQFVDSNMNKLYKSILSKHNNHPMHKYLRWI